MTSNVAVVFISVAMIVVVVVVEVVVVWCIIKRCDVYIYSYDRYDVNEHRCRAFRLSRRTRLFSFSYITLFRKCHSRYYAFSVAWPFGAAHKQQTETFDLLLARTWDEAVLRRRRRRRRRHHRLFNDVKISPNAATTATETPSTSPSSHKYGYVDTHAHLEMIFEKLAPNTKSGLKPFARKNRENVR